MNIGNVAIRNAVHADAPIALILHGNAVDHKVFDVLEEHHAVIGNFVIGIFGNGSRNSIDFVKTVMLAAVQNHFSNTLDGDILLLPLLLDRNRSACVFIGKHVANGIVCHTQMTVLKNQNAFIVQKNGLGNIPNGFSCSFVELWNNDGFACLRCLVKGRLNHIAVRWTIKKFVYINIHVIRTSF